MSSNNLQKKTRTKQQQKFANTAAQINQQFLEVTNVIREAQEKGDNVLQNDNVLNLEKTQ
jgi:hypothetical protein